MATTANDGATGRDKARHPNREECAVVPEPSIGSGRSRCPMSVNLTLPISQRIGRCADPADDLDDTSRVKLRADPICPSSVQARYCARGCLSKPSVTQCSALHGLVSNPILCVG